MPQAKIYDSVSGSWKPVIAGPQGSSGTIAVTAPLTNSGTNTAAVLGVQASPVFSGTVATTDGFKLQSANQYKSEEFYQNSTRRAVIFTEETQQQLVLKNEGTGPIIFSNGGSDRVSIANNGTVTATGLVYSAGFYGDLRGGTNLSTYTNLAAIPANTNTKIANFASLPDGMYGISIMWATGYDNGGGTIYWGTSYAGITGIASAQTYYNSSPQQSLTVSGTQHHRSVGSPTYWMYSDSTNGAYGNLCLWVNFPQITKLEGLTVVAKRLY